MESEILETQKSDLASRYEGDGFVAGLDVFSREEMESYRRQFDDLEGYLGKEQCQTGIQDGHLQEEFIWKLATDARVLNSVAETMGEDILLLGSHFFCKYPDPRATYYVAWHQDVTYWGLQPPVAHTAWVAIDDSNIGNGCMRVLRGSHTDSILTNGTADREGNLLSINQSIPDTELNQDSAVDLILKSGQMSIHHGQLVHSSNPNTSDLRRCGLVVRFVPPSVKQVEKNSVGKHWKAILVRGRDPFRHFPHITSPFLN